MFISRINHLRQQSKYFSKCSNWGSATPQLQQPGARANFSMNSQVPASAQKFSPSQNRLVKSINYHTDQAIQSSFNSNPAGGNQLNQPRSDPPGYHQMTSYQHLNMLPHPGYSANSANDELLKGIAEMMEKNFGIKRNHVHTYKLPYLEWYNLVALPNGYRFPDFSKYTGLGNTSTMEHISRYLA